MFVKLLSPKKSHRHTWLVVKIRMNRKAILLAPFSNKDAAHSVREDLNSFHSFLLSSLGGAWEPKDIFKSEISLKNEILDEIKASAICDYVLVYLIGEGEMVKANLPWREAHLKLNGSDVITERDLNPGTARCSFIFDCSGCNITQTNKSASANISNFSNPNKLEESRIAYNNCLTTSEGGLTKVFVPKLIRRSAYSFTQYLLNEAHLWSLNNRGILDFEEAISLVTKTMQTAGHEILPEIHGGRRLHNFPFAISN